LPERLPGAGVPLTSEYPGWHLRDVAGGAAVTLAAAAAVFVSVADFRRTPLPPEPSLAAAIWVTAVALIGGSALSVVIRLCAGASASLGQWLCRSAVGAVLLMPAALALTRPVDGSVAVGYGVALRRLQRREAGVAFWTGVAT
jgi:hypothetical protein